MIVVVDLGISNNGSLKSALNNIGADVSISSNINDIQNANGLIIPGVGSFEDGMKSIQNLDIIEAIKKFKLSGKPILGICLGMQLFARLSEEFGEHTGLCLVPGIVKRLPSYPGLRVPNIGWQDMAFDEDDIIFSGISNTSAFYFVHSYSLVFTHKPDEIGIIKYGDENITAYYRFGNIYGAQFHPEKSQDNGLLFLSNFVHKICSS